MFFSRLVGACCALGASFFVACEPARRPDAANDVVGEWREAPAPKAKARATTVNDGFADDVRASREAPDAALARDPRGAGNGPTESARAATSEGSARQADESRGYGGYTRMGDGISIVTTPLIVGIPGLFLAAPIVHATRGNWGCAAISLSLRVGVVAGAFAIGYAQCGPDPNAIVLDCGSAKGLEMSALLLPIVMLLDASVIAYDDVPASPRNGAKTTPHDATWSVVPWGTRNSSRASLAFAF
jgi:hypothetical protein